VVDLFLLYGEGDDRQHADDDEHDPGQSGGHAHFVLLKGVLVDQQGDQRGSVARAAVGDDVGAVEFLERLADLGDQVVEDDGGDHGDGDGEELTPLACAVDGGGLVQVGGHALQGSQEQHHGRAELPDTQQADDPQGVVGVGQPGRAVESAEGDHLDQGVDQAVVTEDGAPQHGDGHRAAQDGRDVVSRAEQVDELDVEVQDVSDEQREDQLQGHGDERILEGGDQRLGDPAGGEGVDVVHQAVFADAVEEVHVSKAVEQRLTEGDRFENDKADDPGDQVKQTLVLVAPLLKRRAPDRRRIVCFHQGMPPFYSVI